MYTEQDFDKELGKIAQDTSRLSDKFVKLKNLKDEIQGINSKKGLISRKTLFLAFGSLETRMQKFKDAMNEKPKENTEDIEAEIISNYENHLELMPATQPELKKDEQFLAGKNCSNHINRN